jgi:antimicrobial peptide system SdpB family protein
VFVTSITADGGDQAATLLTLFLIPVALTDPRVWHWESHILPKESEVGAGHVVAASGLLAVEFQVAVIYLHSSIAKFGVSAWAKGTAAYYWLLDPRFGAVSPLHGIIGAVLSNGIGVVVATYGVLAVELALGLGWLFRGRPRRWLLAAGVGLHAVIAVLMGLPSFGVAMSGALVLYLLANDGPGWPGLARPSSPPAGSE